MNRPEVSAAPFARTLARSLSAGALLALLELSLVIATERGLFLSSRELTRYALFALCAVPALCSLLGGLGDLAIALLARGLPWGAERHAARTRLAAALLAWPLLAKLLVELGSGRRLRALPGRELVSVALAGLVAFAIGHVLSRLLRLGATGERASKLRAALVLGLASAGALVVDMYVLRRLYVPLHVALAATALVSAVLAAALVPRREPEQEPSPVLVRALHVLWLTSIGLSLLLGLDLRHAPNARFAVHEAAPISGKLLPLIGGRRSGTSATTTTTTTATTPTTTATSARATLAAGTARAGVDLRGSDVLLITIDALRADCLAAYGGSGLTPQLDALARESAVFARAYTPTPHTSYAVTSLMTGKFMQPLLALAGEIPSGEHPTLPELLRRNGYRTAAFYPPAIFFVDQERFTQFESRQLGFEYVKAQFAPVDRQVGLLQRYLDHAEAGYPLFVWVHVFEPHEPYEPPPAFERGSSPRERYDGEVAAADAGAGQLIAAFRRARPGATVIVSADHGEEHGEHGGHHHGTTLFDEQIRIPLLWSSPGRVSPHTIEAPAELIDITTTLLSALGIPREARMRGDDLSPELAGAPVAGSGGDSAREPRYAFSLIDSARMVSDGRDKLICGARDCQLFDLRGDPRERRDEIDTRVPQAAALRGALDDFLASIPRIEALALDGGGAWPEALTRARLGDASAAGQLVPLLSSARAEVRAAAARMLGELAAANARTVLSGMRMQDSDRMVRAESALAALRLDELDARAQVVELLEQHADQPDLVRRAALALAAVGDRSGEPVLTAMAADEAADEPQRVAALRALAHVGSKQSSGALAKLLPSVRLRPEVAATLGAIGDHRAVPALLAALQLERYPEARTSEARALYALGAKTQASALVRRFLGTESSLNDGVALLLEHGALGRPSGAGADLRAASPVQRGPWQCEPQGCRPLAGASLLLPARGAPPAAARAIIRVHVEGAGRWLRIGESKDALDGGDRELARGLAAARGVELAVEASEGVWLEGIAVVPVTDEIPPPEPEPWEGADAGVEE